MLLADLTFQLEKAIIMKKITTFIALCFCAFNLAFAQDAVIVNRIVFEYDEGGSLVLETPYSDEAIWIKESGEDINEEETLPSLFSIKKKQSEDVLKIFSSKYAAGTKAHLTIHSIDGIQQYSVDADITEIDFDLSTLRKGTYIITLSFNGKTQSKKYYRR